MADCLGERFASGEGIQDALYLTPSMLFQSDEVDGILQSIKKSNDARYENVLSTLLTMYSSANTIYPMRRKAGKESPGTIDQPSLVVSAAVMTIGCAAIGRPSCLGSVAMTTNFIRRYAMATAESFERATQERSTPAPKSDEGEAEVEEIVENEAEREASTRQTVKDKSKLTVTFHMCVESQNEKSPENNGASSPCQSTSLHCKHGAEVQRKQRFS